jgi:hypothetical protein
MVHAYQFMQRRNIMALDLVEPDVALPIRHLNAHVVVRAGHS